MTTNSYKYELVVISYFAPYKNFISRFLKQ